MLAYAANAPKAGARAGSPKSLTLIILGHAAVIAAVLAARPGIIEQVTNGPTTIFDVPIDPPPPPPPERRVDPQPQQPVTQDSFIPQERPIVDMGQTPSIAFDDGPTIQDIGDVIGSGPTTVIDLPRADPIRVGPRLATSEQALKPPYPLDMRRAEQEATLRLKLTIDARGRVTAVDPVGLANPSFLEAARRHILKAWRYKPATEDGSAIPSTTVISLSFRLEDA
jgi:periplasmic protein TonB